MKVDGYVHLSVCDPICVCHSVHVFVQGEKAREACTGGCGRKEEVAGARLSLQDEVAG